MKLSILASIVLFSIMHALALASEDATAIHKHLGTDEQKQAAARWNSSRNSSISNNATPTWNVLRPFSETEQTGFVAISGNTEYELGDLRLAIAKNLPSDASLIVYIDEASSAKKLQALYGKYLGDRLKFLVVPHGEDEVWGRDALPFPVYLQGSSGAQPSFGLVDSIYPQSFEPDAAFSSALSLPMVQTNIYFRGGNLLMDLDSNCFAENANEVAAMTDPTSFFKTYFGCATVTILDQEGGIGDLDERIKLLPGKVVLTDNDAYAQIFQSKGYTVNMIPTTGAEFETYMNTLLVNGTLFVPQMGIASDAAAIQAYNALGFKAVGVYTKKLADRGEGNIHCLTMNYPAGTFTSSALGSEFVEFAGH